MKDKFWDETSRNRIEIVKAFKNIGDKTDFDFLEKIILLDNVSLKLEICRSMYYMGKEGKERLFSLNEEMNGELDLYIAHISDSRN